jgi:N-acetylglutamate synthase-like GNAT family acetyltransferase
VPSSDRACGAIACVQLRRVTDDDRPWIAETIAGAFASKRVVSRGRLIDDASLLEGYLVELDGHAIGCALWLEEGGDAELVAIVTTYRGAGAGVALLDAVVAYARQARWRRLWLITTNDNTDAVRIYQRAGWKWVGWHRDAVAVSRKLKPEVPAIGSHGIAIEHEIEFEYPL